MANNCAACDDIREVDPNLLINGIGSSECTSLKNDTGLVASSGHNDCTDLEDLNDCLVKNMATEINAYNACSWKDFMKLFINNLWTTLEAMICAICGIWSNLTSIRNAMTKLQCLINVLFTGVEFDFGEYTSTGDSYIVAGRGVSFANVSASGTANDVELTYVAGGIAYLTGSLMFYTSNFTDRVAVSNYDDHGVNPTTTASRKGNSKWNDTGYLGAGGELVYEVRIKRSQYPQIGRFFAGHIGQSAGFPFTGEIRAFGAGQYAFGQTGWCDTQTGVAQGSSSDAGHKVPDGWVYLQVRMKSADYALGDANGSQNTPYGLIPMRVSQSGVDCN